MLYILPPLQSQSTPPAGGWRNVCVGGGEEVKRPPKTRLRNLKVVPRNDETSEVPGIVDTSRNSKSLSECYFAGKGTALVLPDADAHPPAPSADVDATMGVVTSPSDLSVGHPPSVSPADENSSAIQRHLQSMFYLLRPEETLKMAVKLESVHPVRTRYLVVVSRMGSRGEESCLLGIDCNEETTVGLVLRVLADTKITLDGDGGFSVSICDSHHIFKPVSVQAMWSALQTLHKVSGKAREGNFYPGGGTHTWVEHYESRVASDRSCLNEWHAMDCLESKRPPSPDSVRARPIEREETEKVIRSTLKEIMMSVDLDEVTSKFIRSRLEEQLDMDLGEFKSFIDQEMLVILGQMDAPTEVFEHVYLGSEWNASNYEELQRNGVGHILNVTREIDNFFPGTFDYLNVRVYDDEKTDLLKHWDDTFKYITKAKNKGSKVLVHCKMGISRSASVVIAYAMKAYNWDFNKALLHVRHKRSCIKPNTNFLLQLETYQGILDAMKNKEKLQRSKSETNLKSPANIKVKVKPEVKSGLELRHLGERPKSWSPDNLQQREDKLLKTNSMSLEDLSQSTLARHVLLPCVNGESYSVSPNQIVHLPGQATPTLNNDPWDPGEDAPIALPVCDNLVWRTAIVVTQNQKVPDDESSWSSYDSAIASSKTELSRHSSWGSGDTRPSRNSSWGSYDCDTPHPGTVRRTKQLLEHPLAEAINDTLLDRARTVERLSTSAPESSELDVEGGKVQNLKKEFEAKAQKRDDKVPRQRFSCDFSKRPPPRPAVKQIAATVIAKAQKKQQQYGKTHPLARIPIKPRHNNPVYNTM